MSRVGMEEAVLKGTVLMEAEEGAIISKRQFGLDVIGFFMARTMILGTNPLGIGYFAVNIVNGNRIGLFFMMVLGLITTGNVNEVIRCSGIFGITWAAALFYKSTMKKAELESIAIAGVTVISLGIAYIMQALILGETDNIWEHISLESLGTVIVVLLFYIGIHYIREGNLTHQIDNEILISLTLIMCAALYGTSGIEWMEISFMEIAAFSCILILGYRYGAGTGAVVGTVCGAIAGYDAGQVMMYLGAYCVMGIMVGTFRKLGRWASIFGLLITVFAVGNLFLPQLLEPGVLKSMAIAMAILVLAPSEWMVRVQNLIPQESSGEHVDELMRQMTEERLEKVSRAFAKLSETLRSQFVTEDEPGKVNNEMVNDIQEKVCSKCIQCKKCWIDSYYHIYSAMHQLFHEAENEGKVNMLTIPDVLSNRCAKLGLLIEEANEITSYYHSEKNIQHRMGEQREVVSSQLEEIGHIIEDFSEEIYQKGHIEKSLEKAITDRLKNIHVLVDSVSIIGNDSFRNEIYVIGKTYKKRSVTTREIAGILSEIYGRRVIPAEGSRSIMTRNGSAAKFIEDTHFKTLQAVTKNNKKGETVSGDNFAFMHLGGGRLVSAISDGMGSGEKACKESELVIELLETLLSAGFKEKAAIKLINSVLILRGAEDHFSTVDMSLIDLYTGVCEFVKLGAATTFIIRDNWIETIKSTTLPVGIIHQVDYDQTVKKLYDGDVIVMVTDGVLDAITSVDKEKVVEDILLEKESSNPQEIADYLMRRIKLICGSEPKDDMTILAIKLMKRP